MARRWNSDPATAGCLAPRKIAAAAICLILPLLASCDNAYPPTAAVFADQLAGAHCRYTHDWDGCHLRNDGFWQWLLREPHHCDEAAVMCLSEMNSPQSQEVLIGVLQSKTNIQTCDGRYFIRTIAVEALGRSGNPDAIPALEAYRDSAPVETISSGASGCAADPEPLEPVEEALERLRGG